MWARVFSKLQAVECEKIRDMSAIFQTREVCNMCDTHFVTRPVFPRFLGILRSVRLIASQRCVNRWIHLVHQSTDEKISWLGTKTSQTSNVNMETLYRNEHNSKLRTWDGKFIIYLNLSTNKYWDSRKFLGITKLMTWNCLVCNLISSVQGYRGKCLTLVERERNGRCRNK